MKSIITGGGGFVGSHLCERLVKDGHEIIVLDNFSLGKIDNLKKTLILAYQLYCNRKWSFSITIRLVALN